MFNITVGWIVRIALIIFFIWAIVDLVRCAHSITCTSHHLENGVYKRRPLTVSEYLRDYLAKPYNRNYFVLIVASWCVLMLLAWYEPVIMKIL